MKSLLVLSSAFILCVAGFAQAAPQSSDPEAQSLITKSKQVLEAIRAKDPQTLNELLAENFQSIDLAGDSGNKRELLGAAQGGFIKDFLFYEPQTFRIDNDSVMVTYNSAITLSDEMLSELAQDNITWPRYSKVSDLWVRQGSDWKLTFEQITPVRAMY